MNKKFFTLLAASCAVLAVNAQTITYDATGKPSSNIGGVATTAIDPRFPWTPFGSTTAPAQTINELKNIDKGTEQNLFQFASGGKLLAMQWKADVQKYQLVMIDPTTGYFIDETLWEVKAFYVGASKDLRYTLVNKASQLPLQLNPAGNLDAAGTITGPAYVEGGVITWSWSNVAKNTTGLEGLLSAAVDENYSVMLKQASTTGGYTDAVEVEVVKNNAVTGGLTFKAYKANPIHLTAAQINAMMTGSKTQAPVQFSMTPEIAGSEYGNALTSGKFTAWENNYTDYTNDATLDNANANADIYQKSSSAIEIANGYVVLSADKELKNLLRVDTVYHNSAKDGRYELRLTTDEAKAPREAFVIQKDYGITDNKLTSAVVTALKKQAQFRFQYNPSEQSVMVQALQYLYLDKDAEVSWWKALTAAGTAGTATSFDPATTYSGTAPTGDYAKVTTLTPKTITPAVGSTEVDLISPAFVGTADNEYVLSKAAVATTWVGGTVAWHNNLIKLTTLTTSPKHTELTVGYDAKDAEFAGINTLIQLGAYTKKDAAYINRGYFYIKNGNEVSTDLLQNGYYRYHDLAATNYTETRYNDDKAAWDLYNTNAYADDHSLVGVEAPNTVYSPAKLENIPAAQWYINGEAGYYTITNRESGINESNNVYLWKVEKGGQVVENTYACKGFANPNVNDTIVIESVPAMDLKAGYLNISQEEAQLETSLFDFKYASYGTDTMYVGENEKSLLQVLNESNTQFKVERVRLAAKDVYTGKDVAFTEDMYYGFPAEKDTLTRAIYRIYKEDVSSNASEGTGLRTRTYVTLEGSKYQLKDVVVNVDADGYTTFDADNNTMKADPRKSFFIKHISNKADEFVLVDPETTVNADAKLGVRAFVNQETGILQPSGLKSQGASNVYNSSVFTFAKVTKFNYRDIRREGADRDTVVLYKDGNSAIKLYEGNAKGANIGLLARDNKEQFTKNLAMFVDTANVRNIDMPIFLLGLRSKDSVEVSNIPNHNHHISTTADYLMVLTDSAKVNKAYMDTYGNIRLGFVNATHFADDKLVLTNSAKTFDLSKKALTPATFAFRYMDTNREAFYIETADTDGKPAWVKVINEVPVVVKNIKEAEVYNVAASTDAPTANEGIVASEVSVVATNGAVIVKNAAGKAVVVSDVLGKVLATTTLTSDDATIAVPAGIVFVTVDGNTTKTVVK